MRLTKLLPLGMIGLLASSFVNAQELSLMNPDSPYADRSCKLTHQIKHKTAFEADCRCGNNRSNTGGIAVCQRPYEVAVNMGKNIGEGPSFAAFHNAHISGGFIDYDNNELIASVYWDSGKEYKGLVVAYNMDNWSRRFVSGDTQDEYGHAELAEGPRFFQLKDIKPGPDGNWYALAFDQAKSTEGVKIFKVDPKTGQRSIVWQGRNADYGQCPSGRKTVRRETQKFVQYTKEGFAIDPKDGSFFIGFSNIKMGGVGIARISQDGKKCDFVTLSGKRDDGLKKGRGFDMRGDMLGYFQRNNKLYAHSTGEKTFYEIDLATGNRKALARKAPKPPAWRHVAWDEKRQVFWVAGKMNSVSVAAFDPAKKKYLVTHKSCAKDWDWFPLCMGGPLRINSLNYGPMFFNKNTGNLLFGQDAVGIVEFEPETGNSINRSL